MNRFLSQFPLNSVLNFHFISRLQMVTNRNLLISNENIIFVPGTAGSIAEEVLLKSLVFTCKNICHVYLTTKQHSKLFNIGNSPECWASCTTALSLCLFATRTQIKFQTFCMQTNKWTWTHAYFECGSDIVWGFICGRSHNTLIEHQHTMQAVDRFLIWISLCYLVYLLLYQHIHTNHCFEINIQIIRIIESVNYWYSQKLWAFDLMQSNTHSLTDDDGDAVEMI